MLLPCTLFSAPEISEIKNIYKELKKQCPDNSTCHKRIIKKNNKWQKLLGTIKKYPIKKQIRAIENFRRKDGLPIGFWGTEKSKDIFPSAVWDSHCSKHQNKDPNKSILIGETYIKNLKRYKNNKHFFLDPIYIARGKKITFYQIPRSELPTHLVNGKLFVTTGHDSIYYQLQISSNGRIKVKAPLKHPPAEGDEVECPKLIRDKIKKKKEYLKFYDGYFCREILDISTKKKSIYIAFWPCHGE